MYTVQKVNLQHKQCYFILKNNIPHFLTNQWLEYKGNGSLLTSRRYAYNLAKYFNYLDSKGTDYTQVTIKLLYSFLDYILYNSKYTKQYHALISKGTLSSYLNTIKEFYKFIDHEKYSFIFSIKVTDIYPNNSTRRKPKTEYIKWYTPEEIETMSHNFLTLRDEAVFLLTLEGFRIDEVLSMTTTSYDDIQGVITPTRSKQSGIRSISLQTRTRTVLDNYIFSERDNIRTKTDYLFVNLNKGINQGTPLSYRNYLAILKRCAIRSGLDPHKIRTHSGRSTRTMELLQYQINNNLTDEQIRLLMGWSSPNSIHSYINYNDDRILLNLAKKINDCR